MANDKQHEALVIERNRLRDWQQTLAALDSNNVEFTFEELEEMLFRQLLPALGDAVDNDDKKLIGVLRSVSARSIALMKQQGARLKAQQRVVESATRTTRPVRKRRTGRAS